MNLKELIRWKEDLEVLNKKWFDREIEEYKEENNRDFEYINKKIPLYGIDELKELPPYIKYYSTQPPVFKLFYNKQLSYLDFFYLGASHSRYEHILGTTIMGTLIMKKLKKIKPEIIDNLEDWEVGAFLTALLIHDCGQPPFSHSLESLSFILGPDENESIPREKIDKILTRRYLNEESTNFIKMLRSPWKSKPGSKRKGSTKSQKFLDFLRSFFDYERFLEKYSDKCFLFQLLNSTFDCDRFDWIRRDQLHIGSQVLKMSEILDRYNNARILSIEDLKSYDYTKLIKDEKTEEPEQPDEKDDEVTTILQEKLTEEEFLKINNRIAFYEDDAKILEKISSERKILYQDYYHGKYCRIFDTVFPNIVYRFLKRKDLIQGTDDEHERIKKEVLKELMKLPDHEFYNFLYSNDKSWLIKESLNNLFMRKFPEIIGEWFILKYFDKSSIEIKEIVDNAFKELIHRAGDYSLALKKSFTNQYPDGNIPVGICLYFFVNKNTLSPGISYDVQKKFWMRLLSNNPTFKSRVRKEINTLRRAYKVEDPDKKGLTPEERRKNTEYEIEQELNHPQVFISIPLYLPASEKLVKLKKTNLLPKEPYKGFDTLIYSADSILTSFEKDEMSESRTNRSYSVMLLAPDYLNTYFNYIKTEFESYLKELPWWS